MLISFFISTIYFKYIFMHETITELLADLGVQPEYTNPVLQQLGVADSKYLRDLKPDKFDDLIAMNALYRPGPMDYIPNFVARKHGKEPITYDHPAMEEYLKDTYGKIGRAHV